MKSNNVDGKNYGNADLSALIGNGDEYFKDVDKTENKTLGFGRNSGLEYKNKYSMASTKLASNDVVDVSKFKKRVEPEKPKVSEISPEEKDEDLLNSSLSETPDQQSDGDDDFDKFFEEFMRDLDNKEDSDNKTTQENTEQQTKLTERIEEHPKVVAKKQPGTRKKKRAIDIDIISGGVGGDII